MGQKTSFFDKDGNSIDQLAAALQSNINALVSSLLHLRLQARARGLVHDRPIQHIRGLLPRALRAAIQRHERNRVSRVLKVRRRVHQRFWTVTALVMAENIRSRYESLLNTTSCHISV
ncbi:uncharacterized protein B0T23DRAFT_402173 [Neurospora hispaniola]|uniref:Uncharacterized protein n=1 Tax=Neurospora hispaniola TaxID=588809 RepID=A0AAJ0IC61_9PEZI|nr:hypothetical protein B0T23DRAFT_402173 [Neurospora hispaniola]